MLLELGSFGLFAPSPRAIPVGLSVGYVAAEAMKGVGVTVAARVGVGADAVTEKLQALAEKTATWSWPVEKLETFQQTTKLIAQFDRTDAQYTLRANV